VKENFLEASYWCGRADVMKVVEEGTSLGLLELKECFDPERRTRILNKKGRSLKTC
jgi:hypothetical protein